MYTLDGGKSMPKMENSMKLKNHRFSLQKGEAKLRCRFSDGNIKDKKLKISLNFNLLIRVCEEPVSKGMASFCFRVFGLPFPPGYTRRHQGQSNCSHNTPSAILCSLLARYNRYWELSFSTWTPNDSDVYWTGFHWGVLQTLQTQNPLVIQADRQQLRSLKSIYMRTKW